jgi:L-asparaginase
VSVLAAGGTIAMAADPAGARPAHDAVSLVAAVPELAARPGLTARTITRAPGAHMTPGDALAVARAARDEAAAGRGVVVTHGTDTLEETAILCEVLGAEAASAPPVALTGAIRPAGATGADGPANLLDAVAAAAHPSTAGCGALVVFGGELHAARQVAKVASATPAAFGSPRGGPVGLAAEGDVVLFARPVRAPALPPPASMDARVEIVPTYLGDDGAALHAAVERGAAGIVLEALGAGHVAQPVLAALTAARAAGVTVAVALRPGRGLFLRGTYGFRGCERDLRAAGVLDAGGLSAQAARMVLMAGLSAGAGDAVLQAALTPPVTPES